MKTLCGLLIILCIVSVWYNLIQESRNIEMEQTIKNISAYYQSELTRLYDFHLQMVVEYNKGR